MKNHSNQHSNPFAFAIVAALFFIFGFVTWLNGVLIPYLKIACELNNFESYLVTFAFYISYFVMAIPSAAILKRTGFKNGMKAGLYCMAVGALLFIPAAMSRMYLLFLTGLFVMGTGLAILQTASNPYVTVIGPVESAARRISIMGICNKVAGTLSPIILGAVVLKDADALVIKLQNMDTIQRAVELDMLASKVIIPYCIISLVLVALALLIHFAHLPEIDTDREDEETQLANHTKISVFQFPNLVLGVIALFLYVGVEVIAGDTIISYGHSQGIGLSRAKLFTSYTLLAMVIGYIIGIITIPKYIKQEKALLFSAVSGILFSIFAVFTEGYVSVMCIALLGLSNALVWPAIWPLAIKGLGRFTKIGSSYLIMAIAGGAVLPLVYGRLADEFDPQRAYYLLIPCYLFIAYYAAYGYKIKNFK